MSKSYSIAAIPTMYNGRQYRSRLEAKWAAFFDAVGWSFEYEPFDLGGWSPDFLIRGRADGGVLLVEVKPWIERDAEVCDRIMSSVRSCGFNPECNAIWLTNGAPERKGSYLSVGWQAYWTEEKSAWQETFFGWVPDGELPKFYPEVLIFAEDLWAGASYGDAGNVNFRHSPTGYVDHSESIWARASNIVQWQARRGKAK